jgi:hypothetical protein
MTRVHVGLAAVIVTALLPATFVFVDVTANPALFRGRDDPLSVFERHVAPLREAVRGARYVGYLAPDGVEREAHLYSLRYALTPVQVIDTLDQPLVVADGVTSATRIPPQLRVRGDFGDGLLLLERVPP